MSLYAEERQQLILSEVRTNGRVEVAALSENLGVTAETIRRDLDRLEQQGLLTRVHGGAIPTSRLEAEPALSHRDVTATAEKSRMARAALPLLPRRGTVLVDAGTSTARLVSILPDDSELRIVTNSLPIATAVVGHPTMTVHLIGGRLRPRTLAAVDAWALSALADINVDLAILGTNGISAERGLTTPDPAEAAVKSAMVAAGRRVIMLADSSKYGKLHFARFADLRDIDVVVSDDALSEEGQAAITSAGAEVMLA